MFTWLFAIVDRVIECSWEFPLESNPNAFWPKVTDTDRFNKDLGLPEIRRRGPGPNGGHMVETMLPWPLMSVWEEMPFEWVEPEYFRLARESACGPWTNLTVHVTLAARDNGGTLLTYRLTAEARYWFWALLMRLQLHRMGRKMAGVFQRYDAEANTQTHVRSRAPVRLARGAEERIHQIMERLHAQGVRSGLIRLLQQFTVSAPDEEAFRMRPYVLADTWQVPRVQALALMLRATLEGWLDMRWEVRCKYCRGKQKLATLKNLGAEAHCDGCNIKFDNQFDRNVEVVFKPNAAIRELSIGEFCAGSPQRTPHVHVQKYIAAGGHVIMRAPSRPGRYRLRDHGATGEQMFEVVAGGARSSATLGIERGAWRSGEVQVTAGATLRIENGRDAPRVFIIETTTEDDATATAFEVTMLDQFRRLFSSESLVPELAMAIENIVVAFTDIRRSTELTRELGNARMFRLNIQHYKIFWEEVSQRGGRILKNGGDGLILCFPNAAAALRAVTTAKKRVEREIPEFKIRAGIHAGPVIASTLPDNPNGGVDYFGDTMNQTARLDPLCGEDDVVISDEIYKDPEVRRMIGDLTSGFSAKAVETTLKGFRERRFTIWTVKHETVFIA